MRRTDTTASMQPLMTQGEELSGAVSTPNSASDVNTTGAVSGWPRSTYAPNVSSACPQSEARHVLKF